MAYDPPFEPPVLDQMLADARTAHDLRTRAHLFRRAAQLTWDVSWTANQEVNGAFEQGLSYKEIREIVDRVDGDWRLIQIAVFQEGVALELCAKAVIAARSSYDDAESRGHRLGETVREIAPGLLESDPDIEKIVWHLEHALVWQGRYPTPTKKLLAKAGYRRSHPTIPTMAAMAGVLFHSHRPDIDRAFAHIDDVASKSGAEVRKA